MFQDPVGLSNELSCEAGSFSCCLPQVFQSEVLRLYFPVLKSWVAWSVQLPSCSSWFIHMQMWDHPLLKPLPHLPQFYSHHLTVSSLHSGFLSPSFIPVWMNVTYLTPWLSDFHIVRFSGSSGYFLFLNLSPFFRLCEEAECTTYTSILSGSQYLSF